MNNEFFDLVKLVGALFAVVVGFTLTGIANNCLVGDEPFERKRLAKGLAKAFIACTGLIIISYVCTIIDLSGLGFKPQTAITSGIIVYSAKLIRNAMGLLGLNKDGKEEKENNEEVITESNFNEGESLKVEEDTDFEEVNLYDKSQKESSNIEIDPNAVG